MDVGKEGHNLVTVVNLVVLQVKVRQAGQLFELLTVTDELDDVS